MRYVPDVLYAVLYVRVSCFIVRGCGVSRRYIVVCYCDMFCVVNVYHDHLKFCVVCINSRRYVGCSECDVVLMLPLFFAASVAMQCAVGLGIACELGARAIIPLSEFFIAGIAPSYLVSKGLLHLDKKGESRQKIQVFFFNVSSNRCLPVFYTRFRYFVEL